MSKLSELSVVIYITYNRLTLMQQFLIQCALRPERVTQFALVFTARVLEHKPLRYKEKWPLFTCTLICFILIVQVILICKEF